MTLSRSLPEQSEALSAYRNYFNNQFSNFSGMEVRETNRGLLQVASAGEFTKYVYLYISSHIRMTYC